MRPFSPRMFPAAVSLRPLVEQTGPSGGVAETFAEGGPSLPARVRYANQRPVVAADGEASLTPAQVAFPADPGAKLGDQIVVAGGRTLRVLAPAQDRGGSGLFVVACQVVD